MSNYGQNCNPPIDSGEIESIWKSATKRTKTTSLPPDAIVNCIKIWKWRQIRGERPQHLEQQKQITNPGDRILKLVNHPSVQQETETREQRHERLMKALEEIEAESRASLRELSYEVLAKEEGLTKRSLKEIWRQECLDKPIQNLDLHDLLSAPPQSKEWVIEGLLELSKVCLLVAQAKTGKTPLINDWAYAVATGTPWSDKFPVSAPGRVLCIQSDENVEHTKQALFLRGFGTKDTSGNIQISHGSVQFISDFSVAQYPKLKKILQEYRPRLVLIDSLTTIGAGLPYDQNSPEFAAEAVYPLTRMIGELGNCSCVITHHTNKSPTELSVDRVAGSGRITAAVDEIWALERVDSKNLSDTRRYFSWLGGHGCGLGEPFDLQVTLNLEDLTFNVDGQVLNRKAETEAERLKPILKGDFQSNKDLILKYLQQRGGTNGWTIQTIGGDLNLSLGVARRDTLKLHTERKVQRRQMECVGKGRPAYLYYCESPDQKSNSAQEPVENSHNADRAKNTNKDHLADVKEQVEVVIFNQSPPDLYSQPLPDKDSGSFPQAVGDTTDFSSAGKIEQKSNEMDGSVITSTGLCDVMALLNPAPQPNPALELQQVELNLNAESECSALGKSVEVWHCGEWKSAVILQHPKNHPDPQYRVAGWKVRLATGHELFVWRAEELRFFGGES